MEKLTITEAEVTQTFPRFYLVKKWTEDGGMWGFKDSWTGIGPDYIGPHRDEMIGMAYLAEKHARHFPPHNCYEHAHEENEAGCCLTYCGLCSITLSITATN